ncbi:MAG: hypothetical protein IM600_09385 [Bacteroidetes bacterium]|nr:hypothetical protein [Bacteroidota bacterium]MCA6443625.1 hypothetical protein [Bacteroidota bacterium]
MYKLFFYLIFLTTLISCIQKRVPQSIKKISPYKTNDIIVFEHLGSEKNDTFFVAYSGDIPKNNNPKTQIVKKNTYKSVCFSSDYHPTEDFRSNPVLIELVPNYKLNKSTPQTNGILFSIYTNSYCLWHFMTFSDLNRCDSISMTVNGKTFNDVLEIKTNYSQESSGFKCNIKTFYWSKKNGYLKFRTSKNQEYVLKNKYNDLNTVEKIRQNEKQKVDNANKRMRST